MNSNASPDQQASSDPYISPGIALLAMAYPEFTISQPEPGRNGPAWTVIRKDPAQPGLYAAVTPDLAELRDILADHAYVRISNALQALTELTITPNGDITWEYRSFRYPHTSERRLITTAIELLDPDHARHLPAMPPDRLQLTQLGAIRYALASYGLTAAIIAADDGVGQSSPPPTPASPTAAPSASAATANSSGPPVHPTTPTAASPSPTSPPPSPALSPKPSIPPSNTTPRNPHDPANPHHHRHHPQKSMVAQAAHRHPPLNTRPHHHNAEHPATTPTEPSSSSPAPPPCPPPSTT